ncbi:MFS transporter [Paenibacillus flagellatus]|uniref:MFS transporter n=1 Tax=Paenibacillus flagellatus TaxID=2211139 RepID=A0A2V5JZ11_9BACL|nr:MFS transporter [Paenibacillus flagellatus]PYI50534.1 MFS transporter [Paenibacillus flagellatus]
MTNRQSGTAGKLHYGWIVAGVTFAALLVSAGIRSLPGVLMLPLEEEFGWDRSGISAAVSINLVLYGLMGPFAAASMERFGVRRMMVTALSLLGAGLALSTATTALWQLNVLWGVVVGLGTSVMANVLGVTVANRWFVRRKGLVVGILTASAATGQLLFLPLLAALSVQAGWRAAVWTAVAGIALMIPVVARWVRNHPADIGVPPYGSDDLVEPAPFVGNLFLRPLSVLRSAMRSGTFWLLAGSFFICGFSTNGLIGTHLIPACGDFGIAEVTAAGLLAFMGVFDLIGTTLSGWLSDRFDSRWLLFWYYGLRGLSLLFLPTALDSGYIQLTLFSVFYGLDWIATVPPTVKLTADKFGPAQAGIVFGWIVAFHQLGAAVAAFEAGLLREWFGSYDVAFMTAGYVCMLAALLSVRIRRTTQVRPARGASA